MKKIFLILLLLFIPISVRADQAQNELLLKTAEIANSNIKDYMKKLDQICRKGSSEECTAQQEQFSKNGSEISKILSNADKYGLSNEPIIKELKANYDVYRNSSRGGFGQEWTFKLASGCGAIYAGGLGDWINDVFTFIKYGGLALVVVLTTMDFLKVVAGDKDDAMKSAFNRFIKRCIAVFLLFLTPVLINFVFDILGDSIKGSDGNVIDVCIDYID